MKILLFLIFFFIFVNPVHIDRKRNPRIVSDTEIDDPSLISPGEVDSRRGDPGSTVDVQVSV